MYGFHFADRMLSQLPTLQAYQVTFTESDRAVSAFWVSSATLRSMWVVTKPEGLNTKRNVRLVVRNKFCVTSYSHLWALDQPSYFLRVTNDTKKAETALSGSLFGSMSKVLSRMPLPLGG